MVAESSRRGSTPEKATTDIAVPTTPTATTRIAASRSATRVMPNGAGQLLFADLNACRVHTEERQHRARQKKDRTRQRNPPLGSGPLRRQHQHRSCAERHQDGEHQHSSSLPPHVVDVVGSHRCVHTMREHKREGREAKSDHDRCQDERLWNGIGIRLHEALLPLRTTGGRARVRPPAVKISRFVPLESRPRPMMSCASRRRSIR